MPDINTFEETMRPDRAGMNIPQRTTRQTQGPAGMGFAPPATKYGEGPPGQIEDVFDRRRLGFVVQRPPGQPSSGLHMGYGGQDPFDPRRLGMDSGSYLSSGYGGGLDDAAGMNDDARGMIEGAGFDVAGKTTDDRVIEKLWGKAVNNLPVGTPDLQIQQEWERLKKIYFDSKYRT